MARHALPTPRYPGWLVLGHAFGGFVDGFVAAVQFGPGGVIAPLAGLDSAGVALAVPFLVLGRPATRTTVAAGLGLVLAQAITQGASGRGVGDSVATALATTALFLAARSRSRRRHGR